MEGTSFPFLNSAMTSIFADKMTIELIQVFGWNPVLQRHLVGYRLDFVMGEKLIAYLKTSDIANEIVIWVGRVPVPSDSIGIVLRQHWIKNRLPLDSRWEFGKTRLRDLRKFLFSNWPVERRKPRLG